MPRDLVLKIISELKVNIDDIKVRFKNIENVTATYHKCTDQDQTSASNKNKVVDSLTADHTHSEKNKDSDDSILTVDMNVHELSDEEEESLTPCL